MYPPIPPAHGTRRRFGEGIPFAGMLLVGCLPPPLKRAWYRWRGARIGRGVALGMFSYIASPDIALEDDVQIAPFTFIRARVRCRIGARSRIHAFTAIDTGIFEMGEDAAVGEQVLVGGLLTPRSALIVGSRSKIFSYSFLNPAEPIVLEEEVGLGGGSYVFAHGSWPSMLDGFPGSFGPVTIGRGVWVGWRSFILPGVTIGEEATIGAASVVTRDVPARTLALGSPARVVKAGAEYMRSVGEDERHALILRWLEELAELLVYEGMQAEFLPQGEDAVLRIGGSTIAYRRRAGSATQGDILLSLDRIGESERRALSGSGQGWFDLAARECALVKDPAWDELRTFLKRYGVRFKVVRA